MDEIRTFCKKHSIPYRISIETEDQCRRNTQDEDRKGVILNRIRHYLKTGTVPAATCFPISVVCVDEPPKNIESTDRLFYGQYDKQNAGMTDLLERLTAGKFEHGAIARILAREFWSKGIAPTYEEFAEAWLIAKMEHNRPNPEWAFLSDRTDGKDTVNWKQLRKEKARKALEMLRQLT
jgi:hypothetical protein